MKKYKLNRYCILLKYKIIQKTYIFMFLVNVYTIDIILIFYIILNCTMHYDVVYIIFFI
jgi:hypothetical protein